MNCRPVFCFALLLMAGFRPLPADPPARSGKLPAENPADLPVPSYTIPGKPSEVAQSHEAVLALAAQVEKNLEADLEKSDLQDKGSLARIHTALYATAMLKKDFGAAGGHLERVRGLQESPVGKLLTGLLTGPLIRAMQAPGADLHATYRDLLAKRLAELPFQEVEGLLDRMRKGQKAASKEQVIGGLATGLDPLVKDGRLSEDAAGALLGAALTLHITLPMREDAVACLDRLFEAHRADSAAGKVTRTPLGTNQIKARGPHFGQPLPGETPVRFAPGILEAVSPWVSGIAFSPDGTECFLHVGDANYGRADMYFSKCVNGAWTPLAEPAFLAGFTLSHEPLYSKDGNTLTFTGKREGGSTDFWTVSRTAAGWAAPVAMPSPINSDANERRSVKVQVLRSAEGVPAVASSGTVLPSLWILNSVSKTL